MLSWTNQSAAVITDGRRWLSTEGNNDDDDDDDDDGSCRWNGMLSRCSRDAACDVADCVSTTDSDNSRVSFVSLLPLPGHLTSSSLLLSHCYRYFSRYNYNNKKLRYRAEHSASNFGANWKLIWLIIGQIFTSDVAVLHFNALTGSDIPLKN